MGNLLGEPFEKYVSGQINGRQKIHGKKFRTPEHISYLNATNGWVKLASGVSLDQARLDLLKKNNNKMANVPIGKQLAMNNVLFNGLTAYNEKKDSKGNIRYSQNSYQGIGKGGKVAYGLDGTDFGYSPMPGILSVDIKDLNRGSIKKATLSIKVFNRNQLEIIDCLYMRLGYTVLLEWGHSQYWNDLTDKLTQQPASLIDTHFFKDKYNKSDYTKFIPLLKEHRKKTRGNYDAMFGTVSNFSWTFESDGSYNCKIEIISLGDIIESLNISVTTKASGLAAKVQQAKIANTIFVDKAAQEPEFFNLYPGLENDLRKFYDEHQVWLNSPYNKRYSIEYAQGNGRVGWTHSTLPFTAEKDKFQSSLSGSKDESLVLKQSNIEKVLGENRAFTVLGSYYAQVVKDEFKKLQTDQKFMKVKFPITNLAGEQLTSNKDINSQDLTKSTSRTSLDSYEIAEIPTDGIPIGSKGYNYNYVLDVKGGNTDKKIEDTLNDNGYNPYQLKGEIWLKSFGNTETIKDPDGDLLARKPLAFINLTATKIGEDKQYNSQDIVKDSFSRFNFSPQQKMILKKITTFDKFKSYVYQKFADGNLIGGADDPQFKKETEAKEAEQQNPNAGENQIAKFARITSERSLRGNFFKYFYNIKNLFAAQPIASEKAKEIRENSGTWFKDDVLFDLADFPEISSRPSINVNLGTQKTVGNLLNPLQTAADSSFVTRWNKDVGYPYYREWDLNEAFYAPYPDANSNKIIGYENGPELTIAGTRKAENRDFFRLNITEIDKSFYMRFGILLGYLRDKNIPHIDSSDSPPMIDLNITNKFNVCYVQDNTISLDPRNVIVRNSNFYDGTPTSRNVFSGIAEFIKNKDNVIYGDLMNIYLNCNMIEELLTELSDKKGEVKLYKFLQSICDKITSSLGGVNNLEVVVDKEDNQIKIIDQTSIPNIKDLYPELFGGNKQAILEVFGYNGSKSNFVTNVAFTTSINKEYATMITIGATSKGSVPGTEATAFSKWNIGITDRFKNNLTSPEEPESDATNPLEQLKEENKPTVENYNTNLKLGFPALGFTEEPAGNKSFLTFNTEFIKNNEKVAKEYYKYQQAYRTLSSKDEDKGIVESSIGFIPFNLSIDMEGLSGIKIYNRLKVNTSFLPSNYDETLDFITTGVNHKISDNKWTTNLATLATSKSVMGK